WGCGPHGEGQGQDRGGREPGTPGEGPHRVAEVREQGVHHSDRSATVGSIATARRTGRRVAPSDATVSPMAAPVYTAGSSGATPNRNARTPRNRNNAANPPHDTPPTATSTLSRTRGLHT